MVNVSLQLHNRSVVLCQFAGWRTWHERHWLLTDSFPTLTISGNFFWVYFLSQFLPPKQTDPRHFFRFFSNPPPKKHSIFFSPTAEFSNLQQLLGIPPWRLFCVLLFVQQQLPVTHHLNKGHPPWVSWWYPERSPPTAEELRRSLSPALQMRCKMVGSLPSLKHRKVVFQPSIFRGYVSFREGKCFRKQWFL